jgi:hypothetical protein
MKTDGTLGGGFGTQSDSTINGTTPLQIGTPYRVRITWTGSLVKLHVDGVEEYSGAQVGVVGTVDSVYIGTFNNAGVPFPSGFLGIISESIVSDGTNNLACWPLEEGLGLPYDVSENGNDTTLNTGTWTTADGIPSWNHENGFTQVSNLYSITEPNGGYDRAYDPTTASLGESFDVLATLIVDLAGTVGSWTVTNPAGLRTYNPNTATNGIFMDVLSTIADDLPSTASVYSLAEPSGGRVRTYNPNTDSIGVAYDVLATILLDIQEAGLIGV